MNARAIIEEAIDPKRILRQMNLTPPTPPKVLDWAKANFHPDQMATYRFYHAIAPLSQEFMLRGIIWLNVYLTSVWYRLVLQYGPSPGSPVFAKWDLNPGFYAHDPASEAQVVRVLDALHRNVLGFLAVEPPGDSNFRKRQWIKDQISAAFEDTKYGLSH